MSDAENGSPTWHHAALGGAVAVLVASSLYLWRSERIDSLDLQFADRIERASLNWLFLVAGEHEVESPIAVVLIDDRTVELAPDLLERRAGTARLVLALREHGSRVIALDLVMTDEEEVVPGPLVERIEAWIPDDADESALQQELLTLSHGDELLAEELKAGSVVLAIHAGQKGETPGEGLSRAKYGQVVPGAVPVRGAKVLASLRMFSRAAARQGAITVWEDINGQVEVVPAAIGLGEAVVAPFSLQAVAEYLDVPRGEVAWMGDRAEIALGDRTLPTERGVLRLNWSQSKVPEYSAVDIVNDAIPAGAIDGRIVFVGYSYLSQDSVTTPFGERSAVVVHAVAANQWLTGYRLGRASPLFDAGWTLLIGFATAAAFLSRRSWVPPVGVIGTFFAAATAPWFAFVVADLWLGFVGPMVAVAGAGSVALASAWVREGIQRRQLRNSFAHYLSGPLVDELVANPSRVTLHGERRDLTVLFTDIRDFTGTADAVPPLDLARFLRQFFSPMTRAVFEHDGYVDKFIGDALMALFGAPVSREDHAARACGAAIAMFQRLPEVAPHAAALGFPLRIGVGINTGEMVVGNLGSEDRFDYTVLGDAVNLASRLEGLTNEYGVFCLVGPRTAAEAGNQFQFRQVDRVRVKGKREPIDLFELLSGPGGTVAAYVGLEVFSKALVDWREGRLAEATSGFEAFVRENPSDRVVQRYLRLAADYGGTLPPNWDGVSNFIRK